MKFPKLSGLFKDTLTKRLFLLMWFALVVSHFAAFLVASPGPLIGNDGTVRLPTLPSLPPTIGPSGPSSPKRDPGKHHDERAGPRPGPHDRPPPKLSRKSGNDPRFGRGPGPGPGNGPGLSWSALTLDYGVRLLLIGLASWIGARWLSRPVKQFSLAAKNLSTSLGTAESEKRLNQNQGTIEIREATKAFNEMADHLDEQFRARGLLIASISHDLRTPLTRIRIRLEKCADKEIALQCINDVREMNELIETVFEIFDSSRHHSANEATDIFAVVQSTVDDMNELDPHITLNGQRTIAPANPVTLRRAVQNLLVNALRYAGQARLVVNSSADSVSIQIDDDGPGIPDELLGSVFKPFFRVEKSRNRNSGGTGLGLYITRELVENQGGKITLKNRPEGGLRAVITLPRR